MHSARSSVDPTRFTYRWREWQEISQEDYEKNYKSKGAKNRTRMDKGKLLIEIYCAAKLCDIPVFKTKPDADAQIHIFEAKYDSRLRERQSRETWHDEYYDFDGPIRIYEKNRKESAKNCYDSCFIWFRDYVLHFFLIQKQAVNLEEWKKHFKEFKEWLKTARGKRNNYDPQPKLKLFSEELVNNHRGAKHLISLFGCLLFIEILWAKNY